MNHLVNREWWPGYSIYSGLNASLSPNKPGILLYPLVGVEWVEVGVKWVMVDVEWIMVGVLGSGGC